MSATIAYYYQSNWIFPLLIVVGGLTTLYTKRNDDVALPDRKEQIHHLGLSKLSGGILIVAWLVIWIAVASVVNTSDYDGNEELYWFEAFYRTGSIIFGGGQVVLPLLLKDVVQYEDVCAGIDGSIIANATASTVCTSYVQVPRANSWITEEQFFAGLGVVQAAEKGDWAAQEALSLHAEQLAQALAFLVNILDPEVLVLGGGLSQLPSHFAGAGIVSVLRFSRPHTTAALAPPPRALTAKAPQLAAAAHDPSSELRPA